MASDLGLNVNLATFRTLDPAIGRWWQVDPKGEMLYGQSPYAWPMNNPITYADPDGDIAPLIVAGLIGAAIGGVGNTIYQATQGNINSWGDGFAAFGIGVGAGFVGGITGGAAAGVGSGSALIATTSFSSSVASGAVSGAIGGASAGLIQNTGNAMYYGNQNFGDALTGPGFQGALWGGIGGAVVGGIAGGIGYRAPGAGPGANTGGDLVEISTGNGGTIKVPGLEVAAQQPAGGLNIATARASGMYTGPVTSYQALPFARSLVNGLTVTNPAGSALSLSIPKNFVSIATEMVKELFMDHLA